jgi:hypothetical protein
MVNVIDLASRRETWSVAYELGDLVFLVSNHGRIKVNVGGEIRTMDLLDAVSMLGRVSERFETNSGL